MADKAGAYGTKASDTDFRKKWDKEEYAEKARKKDQEEKERMQENEERMKQGMYHELILPVHQVNLSYREATTQREKRRFT